METVKLYYENAFLREFDGVVVDCRPQGKKWLVQLDRTAFYPEGGGQPADHGILGGAKVTDFPHLRPGSARGGDRPRGNRLGPPL